MFQYTHRFVKESISDGTLIDVSRTANAIGTRCPTFISRTFWNETIGGSEEALDRILGSMASIHDYHDYEFPGPINLVCYPNLSAQLSFSYSCALVANSELGLILVITEPGGANYLSDASFESPKRPLLLS